MRPSEGLVTAAAAAAVGAAAAAKAGRVRTIGTWFFDTMHFDSTIPGIYKHDVKVRHLAVVALHGLSILYVRSTFTFFRWYQALAGTPH